MSRCPHAVTPHPATTARDPVRSPAATGARGASCPTGALLVTAAGVGITVGGVAPTALAPDSAHTVGAAGETPGEGRRAGTASRPPRVAGTGAPPAPAGCDPIEFELGNGRSPLAAVRSGLELLPFVLDDPVDLDLDRGLRARGRPARSSRGTGRGGPATAP